MSAASARGDRSALVFVFAGLVSMALMLGVTAAIVASCHDRAPPVTKRWEPRGPLAIVTPDVVPGRRVPSVHVGSRFPARAAAPLGDQTWVATPTGVLCYDLTLWSGPSTARPLRVIGASHGLPSPSVNALQPLSPRSMLVGTDRGLVQVGLDGSVEGPLLLEGRRVTALSKGLVGTWRGLYHRSPSRSQSRSRSRSRPRSPSGSASDSMLRLVDGSDTFRVTDLLPCGPERTYVATFSQGLFLLEHQDGLQRLIPVQGLAPDASGHRLAGCRQGDDQTAWVATTFGLYEVRGISGRQSQAWRQHATTVTTERDGRAVLWGTFGEGLRRYDGGRVTTLLERGRVSLIYPRDRSLLVGTDEALSVLRPDGTSVDLSLPGPPPGLVTALAPHEGGLWIGTFDQGLARMLPNGRWERWSIHDPRITGLQVDRRGRLWVGTARGLARQRTSGGGNPSRLARVIDPRGWLRRHVSSIRLQRRENRLWVAVHPGLVAIDLNRPTLRFAYYGATGKEEDRGLVGPTVYGVAFSDGGRQAWVGTDDGLSLLDPAGGRATLTATDLGGLLPDNWINDVRAAAHEDAVYLLTLRSGLTRFSPEGVQVWRTTLMTSPSVLLPLEGGVLFGTNAEGLAAAGSKTTMTTTKTIRTHGPAQGLASTLVAALAYEPEQDRLWIGGSGGVDRVDRASTRFFPALQRRHEHEEHSKGQVETTDSAVPSAAHLRATVAGRRPAGPDRGDL